MITNRKNHVYELTVGGLLLAVGIIVSRIFHMFGTPNIGMVFLPIHISVFIAGLYLGVYYGTVIGFLTPVISSLFGAPIFPFNLIMAFELSAYGFFAGLFMYFLKNYNKSRKVKILKVYISLTLSMIMGRIINAIVLFIMVRFLGIKVPAPITVVASTITGIPGIIIQLLLVPVIVLALYKNQQRYSN